MRINLKLKYILVPTFVFVIIISSFMIFNDTNLINQHKFIDEKDSSSDIFILKVYAAETENTYFTLYWNQNSDNKEHYMNKITRVHSNPPYLII